MENSNTFYDRLLKNQFNEDEQLDIVSKDPCYIIYMIDATTKVQEKAICKEPNVIRYIRDQSEYIKMFAIKQGCLLKYIKEPTFTMEIDAIKINSINIVYIRHHPLFVDELLDLAITYNAILMITKSLETNDCEKSKAMLKTLYDRQRYNYQKQEKLKEKHSYCTIS